MSEKTPCIYILASRKNGTLYTGVTSNLPQRVNQHKMGMVDGFTKKYALHSLVYYEQCETMETAILREKQLKGGSRRKKIDLIVSINPEWKYLFFEL